jgi:hypothetical protein
MKYIFTIALFITPLSFSSDMKSFKNINDIEKILVSVPVTIQGSNAKNLIERLQSLHFKIKGGRMYSYDKKSELDAPGDKVGDAHYSIQITEPTDDFKKKTCDMWGSVDFMKRNGKYYPESRTANWLFKGDCSTKFNAPH